MWLEEIIYATPAMNPCDVDIGLVEFKMQGFHHRWAESTEAAGEET